MRELPLPEHSTLTILLRDDAVVAIRGDLVLLPGDHVCAFVLPADRGLLDLLFGATDARGG